MVFSQEEQKSVFQISNLWRGTPWWALPDFTTQWSISCLQLLGDRRSDHQRVPHKAKSSQCHIHCILSKCFILYVPFLMITHDGYSHTDNNCWLTRLQIHVLHPNITLCGGVYMWGNGSQTATSSLFLSPSGFPGIHSLALRVPCQLASGVGPESPLSAHPWDPPIPASPALGRAPLCPVFM